MEEESERQEVVGTYGEVQPGETGEHSPHGKGVGEVSIVSASELTSADMTSVSVFEEVETSQLQGEGEQGGRALLEDHLSTDQPVPQGTEIVPGEAVVVSPSADVVNGRAEYAGGSLEIDEKKYHLPSIEQGHQMSLENVVKSGGVTTVTGGASLDAHDRREASVKQIESGRDLSESVVSQELKEKPRDDKEEKLGGGEEEEGANISNKETKQEAYEGPELASVERVPQNSPQESQRECERTEVAPTESGSGAKEVQATVSPSVTTSGSVPPNETRAVPSEAIASPVAEQRGQGEESKSQVEESKQQSDKEAKGQSHKESEWMDILGSGELLKKVVQPGRGLSTRPSQQARVKLRTRGILKGRDEAVDRHNAVTFTVGDGDVIQAWDIAVSLMEVGEVAKVKTSARFAYGAAGKPPTIPANADLTYELELLEVLPPVQLASISEEELVEIVDVKKTRGNELYKRGEFNKALTSYHKGLQAVHSYLDGHELPAAKAPPTVQEMLVRCENNIAAAHLKVENYREALSSCESVLKLEANNVKALYRAGRVLAHLGEWQQAVAKLENAAALDPDNKVVQTELQKTIKKREAATKKEKEMYRRMVGGATKETKSKNTPTLYGDSSWGPWPYMAISGVVAVLAIGTAYYLTQRP